MAFAQLIYRESQTDIQIEINVRAQVSRLNDMGFRCRPISGNTLANVKATRAWHIHADFAPDLPCDD